MDHLRPQVVSRPSCPHVHMYTCTCFHLKTFFRTSFTSLVPRPLLFLGEGPGDEATPLLGGGAWGRGHSSSWGRGLGTRPLLFLGRGLGTRPLLLGGGPGDEATPLLGREGPGDEAIVLSTYEKYIGHQVHTFTTIHHWCSMYFFIYAHVKRVGLGDLVHMH